MCSRLHTADPNSWLPLNTPYVKTGQPLMAPQPAVNSHEFNDSLSIVNVVAKMFVRCQSLSSLEKEEKFDGNPLHYYMFMRKIQNRILKIYRRSDPGHALLLLLSATTGRAWKMISSCIMLELSIAQGNALHLLFKLFGFPDLAVKTHIQVVTEGPVIHTDERSLQDFYADLVNCEMIVESFGFSTLLNSPSTVQGTFSRFPKHLKERLTELVSRREYGMNIVSFDLFVEFIDQNCRLVSSRLGRLTGSASSKTPPHVDRWSESRPARACVGRTSSESMPGSLVKSGASTANRKLRCCTAYGSGSHFIWKCELFNKKSPDKRKGLVRQKCLCFNCQKSDHVVKECQSKSRCRSCNRNHHTLLHDNVHSSEYPGLSMGHFFLSHPIPSHSNSCLSHPMGFPSKYNSIKVIKFIKI